ncbi:hypothetical protein FKM82_018477 [Ascaphus truei]
MPSCYAEATSDRLHRTSKLQDRWDHLFPCRDWLARLGIGSFNPIIICAAHQGSVPSKFHHVTDSPKIYHAVKDPSCNKTQHQN